MLEAAAAALILSAPTLQLISTQPFVAGGRHFHARESVTLTLRSSRHVIVRHVRSDRSGAFTASFGAVTITRCAGYVLRAQGSSGSVATLTSPPVRCPPRPPPLP
jgi:hypothetical protein